MANVAVEFPRLARGENFLESELLDTTVGEREFILTWNTTVDAATLMAECNTVVNAPKHADLVEIIGDHRMIDFDDVKELPELLRDLHLVRFNAHAFSVVWMRDDAQGGAQVQVVLAGLPDFMHGMVTKSVKGFSRAEVDQFFDQLREAVEVTAAA